ncbi:MAG: hypothetical protein QF561_04025 [Phycisphaerales bacterium]|jgi:hypothetical protein|nr:hypothetical protein [Phycisphaerales bacterium]
MVRSSIGLLIAALTLALVLPGCERQDAAAHREAVEAIESASRSLSESPAIGETAAGQLRSVAQALQRIRGGSKSLKATRDRLLAQVETRLAEITWQGGLPHRVQATEAMAVLAANLQAAALRFARVKAEEAMLAQPHTDALVGERVVRVRQHQAASDARDQASPDVTNRLTAIARASSAANALRHKAAELEARANEVDGVTGKDFRIEAADLLRQAAAIDARVDNDSTVVELHHQMVLDHLSLQHDHAASGVEVVDEEIHRANQRADAFRSHAASGRDTAESLIADLTAASTSLITLLTGAVQENYEATIGALENAARAAEQAARSGGRDSREVDGLAAIRAQLGLISIASSHRHRLAESMRLLESLSTLGESAIGARWAETRTVLQDSWSQADDVVQRAQTAAAQVASQLGGVLGDSTLSLMESDTEPPADD